MSRLKSSIENNVVVWQYEDMSVLGVLGRLEKSLEDVALYQDKFIEFAPIKKEPKRDFLAVFYFNPPTDFTILKYPDGNASIVTYGLDKAGSIKLVNNISKFCSFQARYPDEEFINTIGSEVATFEVSSYMNCKEAARITNTDVGKVYAAMRYGNFLNRYRGLLFEESQEAAALKFRLPDIFIRK